MHIMHAMLGEIKIRIPTKAPDEDFLTVEYTIHLSSAFGTFSIDNIVKQNGMPISFNQSHVASIAVCSLSLCIMYIPGVAIFYT